MTNKRAVVLGVGGSLEEYKQDAFKDAYVIGVNDAYQIHEIVHSVPLRIDMLIVQDKYQLALRVKPHILETPKEVFMRFISPTWNTFIQRRGNAVLVPSMHHSKKEENINNKSGYALHGHTSVVAGCLQALQDGINDIYIFGHDCSPSHTLHNPQALDTTFRELNFIAGIAQKRGGNLYLASSSWLWNYKHPSEVLPFIVAKYEAEEIVEPVAIEKPKRRRKKRV